MEKAGGKSGSEIVDGSMEESVGITLQQLTDLYVLVNIKGFGPQKFKELHTKGMQPSEVLANPDRLPIAGKRGDEFRAELNKLGNQPNEHWRNIAAQQMQTAHKLGATILSYGHPAYPHNVLDSNNPIPILYVRGAVGVLGSNTTVACVGSRKIRLPYTDLQADFARTATAQGVTVISGFALGADTIAHKAAYESKGRTVCVMPCGLDRPFPPENRELWEELLEYPGAAFVSEFPFGTRAASLTLRKRNKLIVAFARGVLVGQSSGSGGAMNAYRFAREQKKPLATFEEDGKEDTSGNALLAKERQARDMVFPLTSSPDEYRKWLRELSSSI